MFEGVPKETQVLRPPIQHRHRHKRKHMKRMHKHRHKLRRHIHSLNYGGQVYVKSAEVELLELLRSKIFQD